MLRSLKESQWQKPFLLKHEVLALSERIYMFSDPNQAAPQDRFRLLMICAIATVPLRSRGASDLDPFAFFVAACSLVDMIPLLNNLDGVMNMLLIARFSVYYNTGKLPSMRNSA